MSSEWEIAPPLRQRKQTCTMDQTTVSGLWVYEYSLFDGSTAVAGDRSRRGRASAESGGDAIVDIHQADRDRKVSDLFLAKVNVTNWKSLSGARVWDMRVSGSAHARAAFSLSEK